MDIAFFSFHDLTEAGKVLFVSDSIELVLGYTADEVEGRSAFDYFHPDELALARATYANAVSQDKAAVHCYCRLLSSEGAWIQCTCIFTVVHDIVVGSTSVYRQTVKSDDRARMATFIGREYFHSSIVSEEQQVQMTRSTTTPNVVELHESRAALILDRTSQSLPILYATQSVAEIVGLNPHEITGWNLWDCVDAQSLMSAQLSIERAKENDALSYLWFSWRDPRSQEHPSTPASQQPVINTSGHQSTDTRFDRIEVEAFISCTSDGLIMVLRHPRSVSSPEQTVLVGPSHGAFVSPWGGPTPILPPPLPQENLRRAPSPFMASIPQTVEDDGHSRRRSSDEDDDGLSTSA
ncbi:hypothetical protein V1525DRAFT_448554 [Lipomyces kononenkoae]|uniref:Uncharacterized protein n=1 Tax=Lipomyces kononenkoae TaxID=34357 RepID=A0ACC3T896_LIPKO